MNKDQIANLQARAAANHDEMLAIRNEFIEKLFTGERVDGKYVKTDLGVKVKELDINVIRKALNYPSDITSTRIAKVLAKVAKV
jgi:hypothetical protein